MSKELVVIENLELVPFFTKGDNLDSVLEQIEKEAMAFVAGDLSVLKNRDAVKAMVTKVTKSKTYLESQGKDLAAEYKEIPKRIDANRKKTKDFLTDLQARVRKPLTEWEEEDKRIKAEEAARIEAEKIAEEVERDHEMALLMDAEFNRELVAKLAAERAAEEERIKAEEKARLEREAQIAQEAKEKAEREAKEQQERLEREKQEAIEREEKAKRDAIEAEERAKVQAKLAEERRIQQEKDAEAKRLADIEAAKQAEIQRQKDEADRIAADKAKREANTKHKGAINRSVRDHLMATCNLTEAQATDVVKAIAAKDYNLVTVNY